MAILCVSLQNGEEVRASHVTLYPESLMVMAEALAQGPPENPFEVAYLGDLAGALAYGYAQKKFADQDTKKSQQRELDVSHLLHLAKDNARAFNVESIVDVHQLAGRTLIAEGPVFSFDEAVPPNQAQGLFGRRKPAFAGVPVQREDNVRRGFRHLQRNWVLPNWMEAVDCEFKGEKFSISRRDICKITLANDELAGDPSDHTK